MKPESQRIANLADALAELLERERQTLGSSIDSLCRLIKTMQDTTGDRRLQRVLNQLQGLKERQVGVFKISCEDFLEKIKGQAVRLSASDAGNQAAAVITALAQVKAPSLNHLCGTLLDHLIEATGAERGFVLFYRPESTEAEVIAARDFLTTHFSLAEYGFSRTVVTKVLDTNRSVLLEDACNDPGYAQEESVRNLGLRSVLALPLRDGERTVGAVYVENNRLPRAFGKDQVRVAQEAVSFAAGYLRHAGLLPACLTRHKRVVLDAGHASREIIGQDPKISELLETIARIADSGATVLIEGESGTGKELVARALHYQSRRKYAPFVAVNCAALPEHLLESELFGHEAGAFTGATGRYVGRLEQAQAGTLFLDEINELVLPLQSKLLRFLQSHELQRLGGKQAIQVEVRVAAASSKSLKSMTESGEFHEALYYRLNVIPLRIPPLRERRGDIPLLADHFIHKFGAEYGRKIRLQPEVYDLLRSYPFPGNVRELENQMHRLVALAKSDTIRVGDLPSEVLQVTTERISLAKDPVAEALRAPLADLQDLQRRKKIVGEAFDRHELRLAQRAVQQTGSVTEAARQLGIHRTTLHKVLRRAKGRGSS